MHRLVLTLQVGAMLLPACSCGEHPPDHAAPTPDAAVDAALDSGAADAAPDAPPSRDPGWSALPGLPDGCVVERAEHPEVLFEPVWIPCNAGPTGCEEMETGDASVGQEFATHDGDRGYLSAIMSDTGADFPDPTPGEGHTQVQAILTTDGPPIAAWRYEVGVRNRHCFIPASAVGGGYGGFGIYSSGSGATVQIFYAADLQALRAQDTAVATLGADRVHQPISDMFVSDAMTVVGDVSFIAVLLPSAAPRILSAIPGLPTSVPQRPVSVIGRDLFWSDWTNYVRVAHATVEEDTEMFLEVAGGGDIRSFVTDGHDMAWYAAYYGPDGYEYDRVELWTAPYTTSSAELVPRKIADIDPAERSSGEVGDGYFVYERRASERPVRFEMVVYRLSDGRRGIIDYPEGIEIHPLYVAGGAIVAYSNLPGPWRVFRSYLDAVTFE